MANVTRKIGLSLGADIERGLGQQAVERNVAVTIYREAQALKIVVPTNHRDTSYDARLGPGPYAQGHRPSKSEVQINNPERRVARQH